MEKLLVAVFSMLHNEDQLRVIVTSVNPITNPNQTLCLVTIIHSSEISVNLYQNPEHYCLLSLINFNFKRVK
jgi:hypothetical protein